MPAKAPPGDEGNLVELTGPEVFLLNPFPPNNPRDFASFKIPLKNLTYSRHSSVLLMSYVIFFSPFINTGGAKVSL